MSTDKPYRHTGIYLPYEESEEEWKSPSHRRIANQGFLLVKFIQTDTLTLVQSIATGGLYIRKLVRKRAYEYDIPPDLRVSSWGDSRNHKAVALPRQDHNINFAQLDMWQRNGDDQQREYVLYFRSVLSPTTEESHFDLVRVKVLQWRFPCRLSRPISTESAGGA